jgi:hypothetical protein
MTGGASPVPVTVRLAEPPLDEKETVRLKEPVAVGLKLTDTVALAPAARLKEPPETTLKGLVVLTVPVRVLPPVLVTVKLWLEELPVVTVPKPTESAGLTEMTGGASPVPVAVRLAEPPLDEKVMVRLAEPIPVGLNRTDTVALAPAARLKEPPETTLKGLVVLTVPVRVPPPVLVTVKLLSVELPIVTAPKSIVPVGLTDRDGGSWPVPVTVRLKLPPLLVKEIVSL